MKKIYKIIPCLFVICAAFFFTATAQAGSSHNVAGWAWSSNIGWISFNSLNAGDLSGYGVNKDAQGKLSGYAWSSNIGWISFTAADLVGCPSGICEAYEQSNGTLAGWARVCSGTVSGDCKGPSRTDGWDGWISLNGPGYAITYNATNQRYEGFGWGGEVVGWTDFSPTAPANNNCNSQTFSCCVGVCGVTNPPSGIAALVQVDGASAINVEKGKTYTIAWNSSGEPRNCTLKNGTATLSTSAQGSDTGITANYNVGDVIIYDFTCNPVAVGGQPVTSTARVTVVAPPTPGDFVITSCGPSASAVRLNTPVTWSVLVSPATPTSGSYSYSWTGTDNLNGSTASLTKSYASAGIKNATVTVTLSGGGAPVTKTCTGTVRASQNPIIIEI